MCQRTKPHRRVGERETDSCKQKILRCNQRKGEKMKKYKYCKNTDNWDKYKASLNKVTLEFRLDRYLYEKGLASKIKGDNKQFWKYVHKRVCSK